MDEAFLPDKTDSLEYLRKQRWPGEVTCPHYEGADTITKGTTRWGTTLPLSQLQQYFNDLTKSIFSEHQLTLPEMFHIIRGMEADKIAQITQELDRTYKTVLDVMHAVQDALEDDPEFALSGVCEATRSASLLVEKGLEQASPRERGLETFETVKPPVVTRVRRSDGRVRVLVRETLQDVVEDIAEYGDGSVNLCPDQYTIYDGIDEYDEIDGHLAINHVDHYDVGDAHVNHSENRHSSFATGCDGSEVPQNTTYRTI